ncbi:hypothetical protein BJ742DRAFT_769619 [Cladochytrium replicatum]|nr:hypothetical protein BJ742DRAFT_769619 [Cladochytrium replicatum]
MQELYEALRRYRGSPPASSATYFNKDASIVFVPTGAIYTGQSQIEGLMSQMRGSWQYVESMKRLSVSFDAENGVVSEEALFTIRHENLMPWLLPEIPGTGTTIVMPICTVTNIDLVTRKIASQRYYYDGAAALKAVKVLSKATAKGVGWVPDSEVFPKKFTTVFENLYADAAEDLPKQAEVAAAPAAANAASGAGQPSSFNPTTGGSRTSVKLYAPPGGKSNFSLG